jgi:hypothetical protein
LTHYDRSGADVKGIEPASVKITGALDETGAAIIILGSGLFGAFGPEIWLR